MSSRRHGEFRVLAKPPRMRSGRGVLRRPPGGQWICVPGSSPDTTVLVAGSAMNEQAPLPWAVAFAAEVGCVVSTVRLLLGRRIHLRTEHVGRRFHFADGTSAPVYRETVVGGREPEDPCVLVVEFKLRMVRGWWHRAFRWESLLNTPLFVGFPGFVSKLWLAHDENDIYRGIYDWDGPEGAEHYARSLWRVLQLGCVPSSIHYMILPDLRRDELLAAQQLIDRRWPSAATAWWRPVSAE
jgi:hypothetical protein